LTTDFDRDANGDIICFQLVDFLVKTAFGTLCLAKFEFARDEADLAIAATLAPWPTVQLALKPAQCRALAADLLQAADQLEASPGGAPS
jgi:hypothetical protein